MGGVLLGSMLLVSGCLSAVRSDALTRPSLLNPRWEEEAFAEHLEFFRGIQLEEEEAVSFEQVNEYVSARLREAWLQPGVEGRYRLRQAPNDPLGYVGYVGGKHPPVAREAVLVCADLTGRELAGTGNALDAPSGEAFATEATALLEVARVYGIASQYSLLPERSVIFALWPRPLGADPSPLAALRGYLRQPTWRLDKVRAVIYVGLPAPLRAEARALLAPHGIELYRASLPSAQLPAETAGGQQTALGEEANRNRDSMQAAVQRARALAERTHERLRATTLTYDKMLPPLGDTLRVPSVEQPQ